MSVAVSLYTLHPEIFPTDWLVIHQWYSEHIRLEMNLSFPFALVWVSMGQLLATYLLQFANRHKRLMCISLSVIAVCYLLDTVMDIDYISLITVYVSAIFVFILCDAIKQQLRLSAHTRLSILMFFHFSIAGKKGLFLALAGDSLAMHWVYYLLVVLISIGFAEAVLRLEKMRHLSFMRYLH